MHQAVQALHSSPLGLRAVEGKRKIMQNFSCKLVADRPAFAGPLDGDPLAPGPARRAIQATGMRKRNWRVDGS